MIVYGMCEGKCEGTQHRNLGGENLWKGEGKSMEEIGGKFRVCVRVPPRVGMRGLSIGI